MGEVASLTMTIGENLTVSASGNAPVGAATVPFTVSGEVETACASGFGQVRNRDVTTGQQAFALPDGRQLRIECDGSGLSIVPAS